MFIITQKIGCENVIINTMSRVNRLLCILSTTVTVFNLIKDDYVVVLILTLDILSWSNLVLITSPIISNKDTSCTISVFAFPAPLCKDVE